MAASARAPAPVRYSPSMRKDSAPLNENPVRRFREELRLTRSGFSDILKISPSTLRLWEAPNSSRPEGSRLVRLLRMAEQNDYPLDMDEIYYGTGKALKVAAEKKKKKEIALEKDIKRIDDEIDAQFDDELNRA